MVIRSTSLNKLSVSESRITKSSSGISNNSSNYNFSGNKMYRRNGSQNSKSPTSPLNGRQRQPVRSRSMSGLRNISPSKISGNSKSRREESPQRNRQTAVKSRGNE